MRRSNERPPTAPAERIGHLSEEARAMDIDGFPGQVITADHFDYDTAEPCGTAPSTGAPG
jgi:hypothetical protein